MKTLLLISFFIISVQSLFAQEKLPGLQLKSVSAEFKLVSQDYSTLTFDQIRNLSKNPDSFTPIDLSTYHQGSYQFSIQVNDQFLFKSPEGPVNTQGIVTKTRYGVNASFSMLNHKTNEYRKNREITIGMFYQPWLYHQSQYVRTDTVITDSIHFNYAYYDEYSPMLGVEGAYLFITNPDKWISASAGVGLGIGTAIHPQASETFGVISGKVISDSASLYPRYNFNILSNTQNVFTGKSSVLLEAKIPLCVHFRIAGGLGLYLLGEVVASKHIYFQGAPSFSPHITFESAIGLKYRF